MAYRVARGESSHSVANTVSVQFFATVTLTVQQRHLVLWGVCVQRYPPRSFYSYGEEMKRFGFLLILILSGRLLLGQAALPPVYFSHVTLWVDPATFQALRESDFLRN